MTVQMSNCDNNVDPDDNCSMPSASAQHQMEVGHEQADDDCEITQPVCGQSGHEQVSSQSSDSHMSLDNDGQDGGSVQSNGHFHQISPPSSPFNDNFRTTIHHIQSILPKNTKIALVQFSWPHLETLLDYSLEMLKAGHYENEDLLNFISNILPHFFSKFYSDDIIENIQPSIFNHLMAASFKMMEIIVLCVDKDNIKILDFLALMFTPNIRFSYAVLPEPLFEFVYAKETDDRLQNALIVNLINFFGHHGGFAKILKRLQEPNLNMLLVFAYLKPLRNCIDLLTPKSTETYLVPIMEIVPQFLNNLSDEEFKKDVKPDGKCDILNIIIKMLRCFEIKITRSDSQRAVGMLRLKMVLRLLQISTFNGKMNALNELNKLLACMSTHMQGYGIASNNCHCEFGLTPEQLAQWLVDNNVLDIVLKDCLHQPQYVEKLENIIRFLIKENTLSLECLDKIWNVQLGKHEMIVKNVHELISKLTWNFTSDQLNHLFHCFQSSWSNASKKERERLIDLMRRLAEDDQDGSMAHQALTLLWNIAYSDDVDIDIVEQALNAHLKILDYGRTCDKDVLKINWLERCIEELKKPECGTSVVTALKHIREICRLFPENVIREMSEPIQSSKGKSYFIRPRSKNTYRHELLLNLQTNYELVTLVSQNLAAYMDQMRKQCCNCDLSNFDPNFVYNGKFSHCSEVKERLNFLRFFLQEGQMWLGLEQADEIWKCLTEDAIFIQDREICFEWFTALMIERDTDLDPDIIYRFFEANILKLDPSLVDINGIACFESSFKVVNYQQGKLKCRNQVYLMEDSDLFGLDYLWKLILFCEELPAQKAISLLIELYTNLGPKFRYSQVELHHDLINTCFDRLKASYDTISVIENDHDQPRVKVELVKMTRVLSVLYEYINKCDNDFSQERTILPMSYSFRGKPLMLTIKIMNFGRNNEELEISTHTNDSIYAIRNRILNSLKITGNVDAEMYYSNEKIDVSSIKFIAQLNKLQEKLELTVRLMNSNANISCSPEMEGVSLPTFAQLENSLPGVIMSKKPHYANFLFKLADVAMSMRNVALLEKCLSMLHVMPPDAECISLIRSLVKADESVFDAELLASPTKTVYLLGLIYSLLMPANSMGNLSEFQISFIRSTYCFRILGFLTDKTFLSNADSYYKICAYLIIMKIGKFVLPTVAYLKSFSLNFLPNSLMLPNLNESLQFVPSDPIIRKLSLNTAQSLHNIICSNNNMELLEKLSYAPNQEIISAVFYIAWSTATGKLDLFNFDVTKLHEQFISDFAPIDIQSDHPKKELSFEVCNEAIELSTLMFLLSPSELSSIVNIDTWRNFFVDLLFLCNENAIRVNLMQQFTLAITKCVQEKDLLISILNMMFEYLQDVVPHFYQKSGEFFQLFSNLLSYSFHRNFNNIAIFQDILNHEFNLLKHAREYFYYDHQLEIIQLEGHLKITKELVLLQDDNIKLDIGLVDLIVDKFLFTASRLHCLMQQNGDFVLQEIDPIDPICTTPSTQVAAYDLLVALCKDCYGNLHHLSERLKHYLNNFSMTTPNWDFSSNMGIRAMQSFVGLKNAGATCYMNSVLQQLFMIQEVREGILAVDAGSMYLFNDDSDDSHFFNDIRVHSPEDPKTYNINILKQIQIIFGHLLLSKCQFYIPRGFWQQFKLFGGPINLREQQDALEFFNSLFDTLDEALKALHHSPIMSNVFGGTFADQKICNGCPHRYSREESFTTLNVDVHNHHSLLDSLEQYVKGDLLEGDNAYYCEKCDRKVDTVKRLCIKKLPKILVIQLKRFDYDYERESPIKFNDYFEFPRMLDMMPYTVNGLAQIEGEVIEEDLSSCEVDEVSNYELCGVVVHSGQASGGHYYSLISHQTPEGHIRWCKFDDVDVSECKLDDDDEMKNQCFGGDYMAEIFDQIVKKMSLRTQKRWWNAFILLYRKVSLERKPISKSTKMPLPIKKNVLHQNIVFMHQKIQFSEEFYYFMRQLLLCNSRTKDQEIAISTIDLCAKFIFSSCFRAKKMLRGNAVDWYELFVPYLKINPSVRRYFAQTHLFDSTPIFCEFLLESPNQDVRMAFSKLLIFIIHFSLIERENTQDANQIMDSLLQLLQRDVAENSRQSQQYFNLFHALSTLGMEERLHLLQYHVPSRFMAITTDESPGSLARHHFIDLNRLHQVVSILIRCCDVSVRNTANPSLNGRPSANPYMYDGHPYLMLIQPREQDLLFNRKNYLKKILKDAIGMDETHKLLKFCCWENPKFSLYTITELLCHISFSYTYEIKPYFNLLTEIVMISDSWQEHRLRLAFFNENVNSEGIFDMLQNGEMQYDKRKYQCIQFLVNLFQGFEPALSILNESVKTKVIWLVAVKWLEEELRKRYSSFFLHNNSSTNWSSESQPNCNLDSTSNAQITLKHAIAILGEEALQNLCIEEEVETENISEQDDNNNNNAYEEPLSQDLNNVSIVTNPNSNSTNAKDSLL